MKRIIYLGGLARGQGLSAHLRSRHEVGDILAGAGVPLIEFRASIIIGPGSLSFQMVRALVDRLPVMITPRWVANLAQPIYIGDVIEYLAAALDLSATGHTIFEIGGADRISYREIMLAYAGAAGKKRLMIPVPVLTPWLSSLWLSLVTPLQARVGRSLIEGVKNHSTVEDDYALKAFKVRPLGIQESIRMAIKD